MRIVIVTGMSGAGKSHALRMLEDVGYYCVDNLPIELIGNIVELMVKDPEQNKIAVGVDIRSGESIKNIFTEIDRLKYDGHHCEILFLDASQTVLIKRYKETRRNHPLAGNKRLDEQIEEESNLLDFIRKKADYIIDTSTLLPRELKIEIEKIFVSDAKYKNIYITITSFGFKYGIPSDSDMVFDVRFLPNPFYVPGLKPLTGNDQPVYDYVMESNAAHEFLDKLEDMISFVTPRFLSEGRHKLEIAIGCTGGKHRSVTIANALFDRMKNMDYGIKVEHRDIEKDSRRR